MQEWEQGIRPCPQPLADGRRGAAAIGSLIREPIWPGKKQGKREGHGWVYGPKTMEGWGSTYVHKSRSG